MSDNMSNEMTGGESIFAQPTMALPSYIAKQRRNKLLLLLVLLIALAAVGSMFARNYITKEQPLPTVDTIKKGTILPPNFQTVMTGNNLSAENSKRPALRKPLGVAVHPNGNIYATASSTTFGKGKIVVFKPDGSLLFTFDKIDGGRTLQSPVYIAINAKGEIYVSDKRYRAIMIFDKDGKFIRQFVPGNNPGIQWMPLALAFDREDKLYVTDIYAQHRVLVFDKLGRQILTFGSTASTQRKGQNPGKFYFPNGIFVDRDKNIFVADSNNRRVQVFSSTGKFLYIIETGGLPRGILIDERDRLYVVDALGHDISVFKKTDRQAKALTIFGEQGVDFGQFLYPNGIALDKTGRHIIVTDRENNRLQTFTWPTLAAAVSEPTKKALPILAILIGLGLLLMALLMRRRRYFITKDILDKILVQRQLSSLSRVSSKIFVHPNVYQAFKGYKEGDLGVQDIVRPAKADETSVDNIRIMHKLDDEAALLFAAAGRGWVKPRILTENGHNHSVAAGLGIETMDYELFLDYFVL